MTKKNSVLFLCQFFHPEKVSSATLPFDTAVAYAKAGFKVGVMCGYPSEYLIENGDKRIPVEEEISGISIYRLKYRTMGRKNPIGRLINYFSFTLKALRNIKRLKGYEYVVVYSNPPVLPYVAYKAQKKYGNKIIFVSYDVYPEIAINTNSIKTNGAISNIMRHINNKLFPSLYKCVALSHDMEDFLIRNRKIDKNNIVVIPNWYSKEFYVPRRKKEKFRVTYLGNLGICQDVDTILYGALSLRDDKNIEFVIGGHGSKLELVNSFILDNQLGNVFVKSFLTGKDYEQEMVESDCFVVTLEKGLKGLCYPSKFYSYLAYGRPVIVISEPCELTDEVKNNGIGFCVNNGDVDQFVDIIKQMSLSTIDEERIWTHFSNEYQKDKCLTKYLRLIE